jgi:hypothetical protein
LPLGEAEIAQDGLNRLGKALGSAGLLVWSAASVLSALGQSCQVSYFDLIRQIPDPFGVPREDEFPFVRRNGVELLFHHLP